MFLTEGQVRFALSLFPLPSYFFSWKEQSFNIFWNSQVWPFHSLLLSKGDCSRSPPSTVIYPLCLPIAASICELETIFKVAGKCADCCAPQSPTAKCLFHNFKVNREVKFLGSWCCLLCTHGDNQDKTDTDYSNLFFTDPAPLLFIFLLCYYCLTDLPFSSRLIPTLPTALLPWPL